MHEADANIEEIKIKAAGNAPVAYLLVLQKMLGYQEKKRFGTPTFFVRKKSMELNSLVK